MTIEEATKLLKMSEQAIWLKGLEKKRKEAEEMAIKSLEAWEKVKTKIEEAQSSIFCTEDENTCLEMALILIDNQISEVSE